MQMIWTILLNLFLVLATGGWWLLILFIWALVKVIKK